MAQLTFPRRATVTAATAVTAHFPAPRAQVKLGRHALTVADAGAESASRSSVEQRLTTAAQLLDDVRQVRYSRDSRDSRYSR